MTIWWRRMFVRWLLPVLVGCAVLEVVSAILLMVAALLKPGNLFFYFWELLPHPAVSRNADRVQGSLMVAYRPQYDSHPLLGWYMKRLRQGERRPVPSFRPNELRVVILGGSVAEGQGAMRTELSLSARLEHSLNAELAGRYEVLVINEAIGGYVSTQEMILLTTKVMTHDRPHYVIAMDGYNDWIGTVQNLIRGTGTLEPDEWPYPSFLPPRLIKSFDDTRDVGTVSGARRAFVGAAIASIVRHTYTGWFVSGVVMATPHVLRLNEHEAFARYEGASVVPPERAAYHVATERMMASACATSGSCEFLWVLEPQFTCRDTVTPQEHRIRRSRPETFWKSWDRYYDDLRSEIAKDTSFWSSRFLDLSCVAREWRRPFFEDSVHFPAEGHDLVAHRLTDALRARIRASTTRCGRPSACGGS